MVRQIVWPSRGRSQCNKATEAVKAGQKSEHSPALQPCAGLGSLYRFIMTVNNCPKREGVAWRICILFHFSQLPVVHRLGEAFQVDNIHFTKFIIYSPSPVIQHHLPFSKYRYSKIFCSTWSHTVGIPTQMLFSSFRDCYIPIVRPHTQGFWLSRSGARSKKQ